MKDWCGILRCGDGTGGVGSTSSETGDVVDDWDVGVGTE